MLPASTSLPDRSPELSKPVRIRASATASGDQISSTDSPMGCEDRWKAQNEVFEFAASFAISLLIDRADRPVLHFNEQARGSRSLTREQAEAAAACNC